MQGDYHMKMLIFYVSLFSILNTIDYTAKASQDNRLLFFTEEFPPYNFKFNSIKRSIDGISVRVLEKMHKVMKKDEKDFKMELGIWARGYNLAQKRGKKVVLFITARTDARENLFKWVGPITSTTLSLIKRVDSKAVVKSKDDFSKYKYCVIKKDLGEFLIREEKVKDEQIISKTKVKDILSMLLDKQCDFFVYDYRVAVWLMKQLSFDKNDFAAEYTLKKTSTYFAFNKSIPDEIVKEYQNALDTLVKNNPNLIAEIEAQFQ